MKFESLRAHELGIPNHMGDRLSGVISRKIDVIRRIRYFVEDTDWDKEILKGEKRMDLCCWSVLGIETMFFGVICLKMLIR